MKHLNQGSLKKWYGDVSRRSQTGQAIKGKKVSTQPHMYIDVF